LGIPLIRGRMFDERDTESAPHVALISESLARLRWPNQDPLGHTLEFGNMDGDLRLLTIVGVVGDTHEYSLETPARPTIYVDIRQRPKGYFTGVMRANTDPSSVFSAARGIMRELAPDVPPRFRTFSQVYSASLGSRRFNLTLVGVFAGTALLLAMAGIYGVIAYSVTRRTREIGVRMALGASPTNVLSMVLGQGMRTAAIGVVIGIAGSLMLTRTMRSLLFGVTATDPLTFAAVALTLAAVALLACYLPARRATRVDPMVALRHE
jgi:predicted permease